MAVNTFLQTADCWNRFHCTLNLLTHLILQKLWMLHGFMVEEYKVGETCRRQVEKPSANRYERE